MDRRAARAADGMIASLASSALLALSVLLPTTQPSGAPPGQAAGTEGADEPETETRAPATSRALHVSGSSTVAPFVLVLTDGIEAFETQVSSSGTTAGLSALCDLRPGSADLTGASRRIVEAELAGCAAAEVATVVEVPLGLDGIVLAQSDDAPTMRLTAADIYRALAARRPAGPLDCALRRNTARLWSDVRSDLPPRPIRFYGPPLTSGTREVFTRQLVARGARTEPCLAALAATAPQRFEAALALRRDGAWTEAGESDGAVAYALTRLPDAIGIFGLVHAAAQDGLALIPLDGVAPTAEAIADRTYALSRPLYLYTTAGHLTRDPRVIEVIRAAAAPGAVGADGVLTGMGLVPASEAGSAFLIDTETHERTALPLAR